MWRLSFVNTLRNKVFTTLSIENYWLEVLQLYDFSDITLDQIGIVSEIMLSSLTSPNSALWFEEKLEYENTELTPDLIKCVG